jgi:hypothetical protein
LGTTQILHGVQLSGSPVSRTFKVGVWVGVIIAAVIVGVVIWLLRGAGAREGDAWDRTRDGRERERTARTALVRFVSQELGHAWSGLGALSLSALPTLPRLASLPTLKMPAR